MRKEKEKDTDQWPRLFRGLNTKEPRGMVVIKTSMFDDMDEVDVYDAVLEARAKALMEHLTETERAEVELVLRTLDAEDDPQLFWQWVAWVQQKTSFPKDECRELLNYLIDMWFLGQLLGVPG